MLITGVWVCRGGWAIPHSSQWHWPLPQQGGVEPRLIIINIFFNLLIKTLLIDAFLNLKCLSTTSSLKPGAEGGVHR